jgi:signal transduction histidine kinase/streptogramin lyase
MRRWAVPVAAIALPLCLIAELLPIRSYSTADGLAADRIDCIVPDSRGFIWFCTPEGLSRFDGYRFKNFGVAEGLPHRSVHVFLETRSGEYLVGTAHGFCQFRPGGDGKFTTYLPGNSPEENSVSALMQDSAGRIWCGTYAGLFEMRSDHTFRRQRLPAPANGWESIPVGDILEDAGGKLWLATPIGIYVIAKDGSVERIGKEDGLPNDAVNVLFLDKQGRLWAGTRSGLVLMRDGKNGGKVGVQQAYKELGQALVDGPDGTLWVGSGWGIKRWRPDRRPAVLQVLTRANGLIDRWVLALAKDRAGNMWAGTEGAGVMKILPTGFTTFREPDGLASDRVESALTDRAGTVLAVTTSESAPGHHAVNLFDGVKFHAMSLKGYSEHPPWGGRRILLQARSGAWWAATATGLCRYPPVQAADLAHIEPGACYARDTTVFQIFEDSKGRIWASAQVWPSGDGRLMRWDPATKAISWFENGPGKHQLVCAFAEDRDGNIWMNPGDAALSRYDGRHFTRFVAADGVPAGAIYELFVDSGGRLWIASTHGLGVIDKQGSPHFKIRVYKTSDGLASDAINCIIEDAAGRIYAGTGKGVDRLDPRTGRIKHFSTADGLGHGELKMALRDRSGNLWFGTAQGFSRLSPAADRPPAIPSVRIMDLRVGREGYPVSQVGETRISRGDLQPSQNQFQVAFVGFSDEPEANLRYTYTLEGGESGWQGPGRDREANYPGLGPGRYRFLVKAVNSEGQPSATPAEIDFVILPPVWRRWWFETLALAAAACLVLVAYRRRVQGMTARVRLLYEERLDERTRIARELHDTLLQSLAGVSLQLDGVAKQIGPSSEAAAAQIRVVRQQVDASFREARQKVQDLRSPMLQGRALPAVLLESLDQIAAGHPVLLRMTVAGQSRPLREEVDEAVLRIGQEAVANAVRHAQASEIHVSLTYDDRSLSLRIRDDGQGFDLDGAGRRVGHWGLRNMQERAQKIGAEWKVASAAGRGTEIEVMVPLAADK